MSIRETVREIPLVDNHAHAVETLPAAGFAESFAGVFTEGDLTHRDARHTLNYRAALGVLAERFEEADEETLLSRRAEADLGSYTRDCVAETNTETILVDVGYPETPLSTFRGYVDADVYPLFRLEPVIEELLAANREFAAFEGAFVDRVEEALAGEHVALKSIAAYRRGLAVENPDRETARAAFRALQQGWDGRIDDPRLLDYCLHRALELAGEHDAPVQFHTGFGDPDAHPRAVNPTHLVECIEAHPETAIVLLHGGYPHVGEAGYVTATYPNVHLDLSLAVPFAQHGARRIVSTAMELAPTTKLLYGSDAFSTPELFVLAERRFRNALAGTLERVVEQGIVDERYAEGTAHRILRENAIELYELS